MSIVEGSVATIRTELRNPGTKELENASGPLSIEVVRPSGSKIIAKGGEITHDGTGLYHFGALTDESGLWHYRWLDEGQVADEGDFEVESKFAEGEEPDLTDIKVLVPRARRKLEGPWGNPNGRPPLLDSEIYALTADACSILKLLSGGWFEHEVKVKKRDPLGGFPTEWKTDTVLEEYEAAAVCAQAALEYYTHLFTTMRVSEAVKNEGTEWTYTLSAQLLRGYLQSLKEERDLGIAGLRFNKPVLDRFASNIRVRDQATVAVLEWWAGQFDVNTAGGLPGGQEAAVVPVFYPPGAEY